jgi:hypothetical protein
MVTEIDHLTGDPLATVRSYLDTARRGMTRPGQITGARTMTPGAAR